MGIHLTRHARQRMRLYQISLEEVEQTIQNGQQGEARGGVKSELQMGGRLLRVIWVLHGDSRVVKTVYPVRQRKGG